MAGEITLEENGSNPPSETQEDQIRKALGFNDANGKVPIAQLPSRAVVLDEDGETLLARRLLLSSNGGLNYVEFSSSGVTFIVSSAPVAFPDADPDRVQYFMATENSDGSADLWRGARNAAPSTPKKGWMYYDLNLGVVRVYDLDQGWLNMAVLA